MENKLSRKESDEPQISSPDPQERIIARRLRVQKRNLAARKRHQTLEDGKEISSEEETLLEKQVEKSTIELSTLTHEGRELITNVRVAADAHEVKRRCDQATAKQDRIKKLEEEANIAQDKFDAINSKWDSISLLNDPLDLNKQTELQREKCVDLIGQKDKLIADLKAELKAGDERYVKDQQKQADDIALLVERIDSQIAIMRRAYRRELVLIQEAIDIERKQTMEMNNKKWETLYKQREEDEVNNLQQRFVALSEHNKLMQDILVHHQEKFRSTKISLEKDIQVLQQQLEQVKAICLLNKEKMEYNYQVLKKRDEESLLIRSQQKRRINKLQDVVTTLRRKILAMEQSTQAEVKRLTSEVIKLHRNIKDIQLKAQHFCSVNAAKYFQLWKFNHDSAQKLCDKILSIDRLIHEQQLGIAWQPVATTLITMRDLPSYRAAIEEIVVNKSAGKLLDGKTNDLSGERVLKQILQAVADRSGFLIEDRLNMLLAPYTPSQTTLVCIDNVFSALGVNRQEDMELLRQTMEPYIVCVTCQPILEAVRPISPPALLPFRDISEEEFKSRVMKKLKDTLEEGEKVAQMKRERLHKDSEMSDVAADLNPSPRTTESHTDSSVTPWMALSTLEITDRSIMSVVPPSASHGDAKSAAQSVFTMVFSSRKPLNPVPEYSSHSETSTTSSTHEIPQDSSEEEKKEEKKDMAYHDPTHTLSINPVFVLRALREFVQRFQTTKHEHENQMGDKREIGGKKSLSRQISDADVRRYWEQFRDAFPAEREKLWDCLHLGLQRYHSMLQERHKVNIQIEQLKGQNADLRRLLQKYALPNNMKAAKESRYSLPPLSVKTPTAPAPTPARLVLTFNDTSRL